MILPQISTAVPATSRKLQAKVEKIVLKDNRRVIFISFLAALFVLSAFIFA